MTTILARVYDAAIAVSASDSVADPQGPFAGLLVAAAGTVKFTDSLGNTVVTDSLAAGTELRVAVSRVWSTGTSATVYGLRAMPFVPRVSS